MDTSNRIKSLTRIKVLHVNTDLTRSLTSNSPGLCRSSLQHVSDICRCAACVDVAGLSYVWKMTNIHRQRGEEEKSVTSSEVAVKSRSRHSVISSQVITWD